MRGARTRRSASKLGASVGDVQERTVAMESASMFIDQKIKELGDWRGKTLAKVRAIIHAADPEIVEELKWVKPTSPGTPVFSHGGIVCTGETYKNAIKLTFAKGDCVARPCGPVQLQPGRECQARHRYSRRRQDRRGGLKGTHPRCRGAQSPRQRKSEAAAINKLLRPLVEDGATI